MTQKITMYSGGLAPWLCEYQKTDGTYGIFLYATSAAQLLHDYAAELPGLKVLGEAVERIDATKGSE